MTAGLEPTSPAGKDLAQDGLAQVLGVPEVGVHLGLSYAQEGEATVDFGDDAVLFGEGRQRYW